MSEISDILTTLKRLRKYASYFEWTDKQRKELGVVEELIKAMELSGEKRFHSPRYGPSANHAPDCVAVNQNGELVAIEVCELVSGKAIQCNIGAKDAKDMVYCDWLPEHVTEEVSKILIKKDNVNYIEGPYSNIVVVIHSDEMVVLHNTCADALESRIYEKPKVINEAYFLFSYDPGFKFCPYVKLNFREPK
jgi:hypothetical protein